MITVEKKVSELQIGDKMQSAEGKCLEVKELSNGMYRNSTLITFHTGAWSCSHNNTIVKITQNEKEN